MICPPTPPPSHLVEAITSPHSPVSLPPYSPTPLRYSLTQETRALTKVLKCVDWGDALEAKQVRGGREAGAGQERGGRTGEGTSAVSLAGAVRRRCTTQPPSL